jgi:hypothetical protein
MEDVIAYCNSKFRIDFNTLSLENKLKVNEQYLVEKKIIAAQQQGNKYMSMCYICNIL